MSSSNASAGTSMRPNTRAQRKLLDANQVQIQTDGQKGESGTKAEQHNMRANDEMYTIYVLGSNKKQYANDFRRDATIGQVVMKLSNDWDVPQGHMRVFAVDEEKQRKVLEDPDFQWPAEKDKALLLGTSIKKALKLGASQRPDEEGTHFFVLIQEKASDPGGPKRKAEEPAEGNEERSKRQRQDPVLQNVQRAVSFAFNAPTPSQAATHSGMRTANATTTILDGRARRIGVSVGIFCPIFADLLADLRSSANEGPPAEVCRLVEKLCADSSEEYASEDERIAAISPTMDALLGQTSMKTVSSQNTSSDRSYVTSVFRDKSGESENATVEYKNTLGSGQTEPIFQGVSAARKYWAQPQRNKVRQVSPHPVISFAVAGAWMFVQLVVFVEAVIVETVPELCGPLFANAGQHDKYIRELAKKFSCLNKAMLRLRNYYNELPNPPLADPIAPYLPAWTLFELSDSDNQEGRLTYDKRLMDDFRSPIYEAELRTVDSERTKPCVVKFCSRWGTWVHNLLAEKGYAPQLYGVKELPDGTKMVVMEKLSGESIFKIGEVPASVANDFRTALDTLRVAGLVHGDLRATNLMCCSEKNGSWVGKIIDFDWADKEGSARYPFNLNDTSDIPWASGVGRGGLIKHAHDVHMLEVSLHGKSVAYRSQSVMNR
ncbi:hypothetical protein DACRYDRAFT_22131 [Dacryopinax primogenitus]|uniref:Uncharacterized protein n=1 Tax=Dacryopinax primogenitus (strain DJM 731) TaxID=1858805 RepID=M5G0Q2_DACPD|nr:uncharacterized protein DACRYDRAFT_22131 [Dacryopinax primogenitus]EJU01685.1 hypothetical protein DACRYDRAFT_22131 [Dacryopinax primogenitus]